PGLRRRALFLPRAPQPARCTYIVAADSSFPEHAFRKFSFVSLWRRHIYAPHEKARKRCAAIWFCRSPEQRGSLPMSIFTKSLGAAAFLLASAAVASAFPATSTTSLNVR